MTLLSFCAAPVFLKNTKTGHDLFSQEKPQAIVDSERELRKGYMDSKKQSGVEAPQYRVERIQRKEAEKTQYTANKNEQYKQH